MYLGLTLNERKDKTEKLMTDKKMTLRDTIAPKSDQLNYDDVQDGTLTVKVTNLAMGNQEQPVIVKIADADTSEPLRDYKPCKSMRRVLIAVWGDKGKDWIGQSMTLYGDPNVKFGGVSVGGIRISHMTGITEPKEIMLTTTRSKRAPFVVKPLSLEDQTNEG
jgi:hypothetical protein